MSWLAWKKITLPVFTAEPACRDADPELFFRDEGAGPTPTDVLDAARAVCHSCPVIRECRDWAVERDMHGMWGGLTRTERADLRRLRRGNGGPDTPEVIAERRRVLMELDDPPGRDSATGRYVEKRAQSCPEA